MGKPGQHFGGHASAARFDIASMQPLMERELDHRVQITMLAAIARTGAALVYAGQTSDISPASSASPVGGALRLV
jgi:hypothetical protein